MQCPKLWSSKTASLCSLVLIGACATGVEPEGSGGRTSAGGNAGIGGTAGTDGGSSAAPAPGLAVAPDRAEPAREARRRSDKGVQLPSVRGAPARWTAADPQAQPAARAAVSAVPRARTERAAPQARAGAPRARVAALRAAAARAVPAAQAALPVRAVPAATAVPAIRPTRFRCPRAARANHPHNAAPRKAAAWRRRAASTYCAAWPAALARAPTTAPLA
jgi:hypothetical protein